jgi:intracellular sulfur oxidation DsrE/DsrF family protein
MNRRLVFAAFAAAILSFALPATADQAKARPSAGREKVIFQVSDADPAKWNLALNNAKNVQQDIGGKGADIEIVAYGPGIGMLKMESVVATGVGEAIASGVKIVACENTMHAQKLGRDDMLSRIGYVKAGVVELMRRQREGYAYIRP